jgi:hypothetical protein
MMSWKAGMVSERVEKRANSNRSVPLDTTRDRFLCMPMSLPRGLQSGLSNASQKTKMDSRIF